MDGYITYKGRQYKVREEKRFGLSGTDLKNILDLEGIVSFKNMIELQLYRNQISELKGLEHFTHLLTLDLARNKIRKISNLDFLKNLKKLNLSRNQIEKIEGLDNLEKLELLNLSRNKIKKIENLNHLKNLKELRLAFNEISKIENLDELKNLEILSLTDNFNITTIENLENLTNLKNLIIEGCRIKNISGLSTLKNLESLILWAYDIEDIVTEIEGLEHLVNLEYVHINSYKINTEDMNNFDMVVLLRFACMIKANNFKSIEDWQKIFKGFPRSFDKFQGMNTEYKVEWYLHQCSENILNVLQKILHDSEYNVIKKDQEQEWNEIFKLAKEVFSRDGPRKTLREMIIEEEKEEYGMEDDDFKE